MAVRRRAVNCWGSARFSSAIAWCPQQISPIERRSTISAVSMRDSLVDLIRASIDATAAQVFGEGQCARRMRTVRAKWPRVDRLKLVVCSFPEGPRVHQHCEFILFVRRILTAPDWEFATDRLAIKFWRPTTRDISQMWAVSGSPAGCPASSDARISLAMTGARRKTSSPTAFARAFSTALQPAATGGSPIPRAPTGVSGSGMSSAAHCIFAGASRIVGGLFW